MAINWFSIYILFFPKPPPLPHSGCRNLPNFLFVFVPLKPLSTLGLLPPRLVDWLLNIEQISSLKELNRRGSDSEKPGVIMGEGEAMDWKKGFEWKCA